MKDQYVADIGDYGKYSLLRAFAEAGVKVGVNWYYTEGDKTNDGKFKEYLEPEKEDKFAHYCPEVYYALQAIPEDQRKIVTIKERKIIPDGCYFGTEMAFEGTPDERWQQRCEWFDQSLKKLAPADLIYLDPDNGLLANEKIQRRKVALKYALPDEVVKYYREEKKNVVYYCHKGRRKEDTWEEYKRFMLEKDGCKKAEQIILTYHKGTQRSYVFLIHHKDYSRYKKIIDAFLSKWPKEFFELEEYKLPQMR